MIVIMSKSMREEELQGVISTIENHGLQAHIVRGAEKTIVGAVGDKSRLVKIPFQAMPGVEEVIPIITPYKLASRDFKPEDTIININGVTIGGNTIPVVAGPCAVESKEKLLEIACQVKEAGAQLLRGGAYKPRTSPYSFQGLEEEGLKHLALAREKTGLPIVTEAVDMNSLEKVAYYADVIQIGARNMQNFALLRAAAKSNKPVMLKRGLSATIEEWILAAEYIMSAGNPQVILCERGIRTFETYTRNTLDLSAVPIIKHLSHLPIIVDPSHGTGKWRWIQPMSQAGIAAGADGLMVEVHQNPSQALSDGGQSLTPEKFKIMMDKIKGVALAVGREIAL